MIFDYRERKFYDNHKNDTLEIVNLQFAVIPDNPVGFSIAENAEPQENMIKMFTNPLFRFKDGILKVYSGGRRVVEIKDLLFIMSDSEIASHNPWSYNHEKIQDIAEKRNVLPKEVKEAVQIALVRMAGLNGIDVSGLNYFNDKLICMVYPLIRSIANENTNFHKVLEDIGSIFGDLQDDLRYVIPYYIMDCKSVGEAIQLYLGTKSKNINRFVVSNLVEKIDLKTKLGEQVLDILTRNSDKIFGNIVDLNKTKILTSYTNINLDVLIFLRFLKDVFDNNVDNIQTLMFKAQPFVNSKTTKCNLKIAKFLLVNFSVSKRMSLLLEHFTTNYGLLLDTATQYETYQEAASIPNNLKIKYPNGIEIPKNFKDLKELHDKISKAYNEIKAEAENKHFSYSEIESKVDGLSVGDVELVLPPNSSTLVTWGRDQKHCVASYADRVLRKECLIVGVKIAGENLYTLEVVIKQHETEYGYQIKQFYGMLNSSPEKNGHSELRSQVNELLSSVFTHKYSIEEIGMDHRFDAIRYAAGVD